MEDTEGMDVPLRFIGRIILLCVVMLITFLAAIVVTIKFNIVVAIVSCLIPGSILAGFILRELNEMIFRKDKDDGMQNQTPAPPSSTSAD